jgi:hypothetical protein
LLSKQGSFRTLTKSDDNSDMACTNKDIISDDRTITSCDDMVMKRHDQTSENFTVKAQLCHLSTDDCTDSKVSTAFSSPVKTPQSKKISQECIPAFSISKQLIWKVEDDGYWNENELSNSELASPLLENYCSTMSNTILGDSPVRSLDIELDSMFRLDNFNMIPKSVEVELLPSEFALQGELNIDDFFLTCPSQKESKEERAEFHY